MDSRTKATSVIVEDPQPELEAGVVQITFLGTGTSASNPHVNCLLGVSKGTTSGGCATCRKGLVGDPSNNPDYRGNPSMMIRFRKSTQTKTKNVQIDAGKSFMESARRWYPRVGISHLDALVLTHEHADATLGIDDLRSVQKSGTTLDIFLSNQCYGHMKQVFPYLVRSEPRDLVKERQEEQEQHKQNGVQLESNATDAAAVSQPVKASPPSDPPAEQSKANVIVKKDSDDGKPNVKKLFLASLKWNIVCAPEVDEPLVPFNVEGLDLLPLPVWHGANFLSLAFMFGPPDRRFLYISDVSGFPESTLECIMAQEHIDTLVLDLLHRDNVYPTHFSFKASIEFTTALKPSQVYFVGMSHDFDHAATTKEFAKLSLEIGVDMHLARDGLTLSYADFV